MSTENTRPTITVPYNDPPYEYSFVEPGTIPGSCSVVFLTRDQIISYFNQHASQHSLTYDDVVADFCAIHWATKISQPT